MKEDEPLKREDGKWLVGGDGSTGRTTNQSPGKKKLAIGFSGKWQVGPVDQLIRNALQ